MMFGESSPNHWPLRIPVWCKKILLKSFKNVAHFHIREQFLIYGFLKVLRFHFHLHLWGNRNAEINFTKHSILFPREIQVINYVAASSEGNSIQCKGGLLAPMQRLGQPGHCEGDAQMYWVHILQISRKEMKHPKLCAPSGSVTSL